MISFDVPLKYKSTGERETNKAVSILGSGCVCVLECVCVHVGVCGRVAVCVCVGRGRRGQPYF